MINFPLSIALSEACQCWYVVFSTSCNLKYYLISLVLLFFDWWSLFRSMVVNLWVPTYFIIIYYLKIFLFNYFTFFNYEIVLDSQNSAKILNSILKYLITSFPNYSSVLIRIKVLILINFYEIISRLFSNFLTYPSNILFKLGANPGSHIIFHC